MKYIESLANPLIASTSKLHESWARKEFKAFLAEGSRTVTTLIESGASIEALFVTDESLVPASYTGEPYHVAWRVMKRLTGAHTPSGILARVALPEKTPLAQDRALILYGLQDPGNVGALIRSAIACGVQDIACVTSADPFGYKGVQASAGTLGYARVGLWTWQEILDQRTDVPLIALTPRNGAAPHSRKSGWFVVGSEAHGLPDEVIAQCNEQITLPMPGSAESFNAAVAGSLALYLSFVHTSTL